ncbi:MAG TPA: hypothetical protein VF778_12440, partial [Xanthobacteraceae bacterium]
MNLQNDFILLALSLAPVTRSKANERIFRYQPLNLKLIPARTMFSVRLALTGMPLAVNGAAEQTVTIQVT